ncbi:hypothetical protein [Vibrio splendidus]|uniref:hypothetical protein n=1 Tax=Vibrio splendidus TaxID=29497 RepID=UPI000C832C93|nr:hypothetical protein [Vibrio splendidus]PMI76297.1 hypothetical protein BCU38_06810 [Vibrio splendidus]
MASIVETLHVEHDPRFLFEVSFDIDLDSNQDDIDSRIEIAKNALKGHPSNELEKRKKIFTQSHIALSEYGWIDHSDYVTRYFIWYLMLLTVRSQSINTSNINNLLSSGFDFKIAFGRDEQVEKTPSIPGFIDKGSKVDIHTIICLHYLFLEKDLDATNQQKALDFIKKQILGFNRSNFYKLTQKENQSRAKWTIARLENDGVTLPFKIPHNEKCRSLSLAISLYLWNRASFFEPSIFSSSESSISKSEYVHKLNLSWNQFKHRENNKRKRVKAYNFEMEESLQQKIDYLSKKLDMKKNKLIEHLVTKEYKEQHQKEKD